MAKNVVTPGNLDADAIVDAGKGAIRFESIIETAGAPTTPPSVQEKAWVAVDPATGEQWAWMPSLPSWVSLAEVAFAIGTPFATGAPVTADDPVLRITYDPATEQGSWQVAADFGAGLMWGAAMPVRGIEVGHGAPTSSAENPSGFYVDLDTGEVYSAWGIPSARTWRKMNGWDLAGNAAAPGDVLGTTNGEDLRIIAGGQDRIVVDAGGTNVLIGDQSITTTGPHRQMFVGSAHPEFGFDGFLSAAGDILTPSNGAPAYVLGQSGPTDAAIQASAVANDATSAARTNLSAHPGNSIASVLAQTSATSSRADNRATADYGLTELVGSTPSLEARLTTEANDATGQASANFAATDTGGIGSATVQANLSPSTISGAAGIEATVNSGTESRTARHFAATDTTWPHAEMSARMDDQLGTGDIRAAVATAAFLDASDTVGVQLEASTQTESATLELTPRGVKHAALDTAGTATPPAGGRQPVLVPASDPGGPGVGAGTYVRSAQFQLAINVATNSLDLVATDHSGGTVALVCSAPVALNAATGNYELVP